ncbi:MAG: ferritin [Defluviitaleaceae bacterium]|nr:ferritin [Defluviitaleaceae bacterium]
MLSNKLLDALSNQVNAEYYSAYLYLVMSAAADEMGLKGCSNWLFCQAQEEMAHGTHIYKYILERGAAPTFAAIDLPPTSFEDIHKVFAMVLEHEQKVSKMCNSLASLAMQESDHAGYQFMMWFVNEQVEEEASATEILNKLKLIGDDSGMLLTLDNELAARMFQDPFPAE